MAIQNFSPLQLNSTLSVGVDDTGHDVKFFGATSGKYMLWDESADALILPDSTFAKFGTGGDLTIQHNGTNSEIGNSTGQLNIYNHADNSDINFMADDNSGGIETYFFLDGSNNFTVSNKYIRFVDGAGVLLGSSTDAQLIHDGTNTVIQNNTGDLFIKNAADDKDIIFQSDDGSGGVAEYMSLDGSIGYVKFTKPALFLDNVVAGFGGNVDLVLSHDATNSHIANATGDLKITQNANDKDIIFNCDDGSGGNTAYLTLDGSASQILIAKETVFGDAILGSFGAGRDLRIQHSGSDAYMDNYTGDMYFRQTADDKDIIFRSDDGSGGLATYLTIDGSAGTIEVAKPMNFADDVTLTSAGSQQPLLTLKTTHTTKTASAELQFLKDAADTEDGENLGIITFYGEDEGNNNTKFGHIKCHIQESTNGQEGGSIKLAVATHDGEMVNGLVISDGDAEDEIDVTIGSTATSMTTVAGNLTVNGAIVSVGGSNANLEMNAGSDIILEADNEGGGNASSIQYLDAAGGNKIILGVNSGVVQLCNRAANGTVTIRANTSTAGSSGETLNSTYTDTEATFAVPVVCEADSTVGWHGSVTRVKILPRDFQSDNSGRPALTVTASNEAHLASNASSNLFASIPIPTGFKATHVKIHGSDTGQTFTVKEANIANKTTVTRGTATALETEKAITNVNSTTTNYILIEVSSDGTTDEIHGGYMTIAAI